ncbi:MAG: ParM/StbA family protein [Leptolyngbyaceae cyanobacterium SM1_3_5]|nr:ParM/StbA family protein [Leptolyngbyaceae cyanobacterium SM1_3_5]
MPSATLQIGCDVGSSLSKIIYAIDGKHPQTLMMEPDVIELPAKSVEGLSLTARPEDQAWVKLDRDAANVQVCGFLARQYLAIERIELLKYEQALYKFLAAVGAIAAKEQVDRLSIQAAMLLPYGEITSRDVVQQQLATGIKKYYFQNTLIRGRLDSFQCQPEGGGMLMKLVGQYGQDWLLSKRVVILMFGYRNISCISFNRGMIERQHSGTSDLGFVKLIDKVIARSAGQNRQALIEAIYKIGADVQSDHPELRCLIRSSQSENVEAEAKMLVDAIKSARHEYWTVVQSWLNSVVPSEVKELVISGGTALYLKGELDRFFAWAEPEWITSSDLLQSTDAADQIRFADVTALFKSAFSTEKAA